MATWEEDIVTAITRLGGTGTYSAIYRELETLRPSLTPAWKESVRRTVQNHSSDSRGYRAGSSDLLFSVKGLGQGVWGVRALVSSTPQAVDLPEGNSAPSRASQTTYRILRDTSLARQIKLLHRDACQLCGETLRISASKTYSEAHHIIPLGGVHAGPDTAENVIVLCPNHHALCDMGAIALSKASIRQVHGHEIADASLDYHNKKILGQVWR